MLKNLFLILSLACLATSCSSSRPTTNRPTPSATTTRTTSSSGSSIQFINNIAIKPDARRDNTGSSVTTANLSNNKTGHAGYASGEIENYPALHFKYALLEHASAEHRDNPKLLSFMEYPHHAPYHYSGTPPRG